MAEARCARVAAVRNDTMEARWSAPSGWPIVEEGLLMVGLEDVMIVCVEPKISDATYARHLEELARAIDERDPSFKIGVLYDCVGGVDRDVRRQQQAAAVLASRRAKLAATTAGFTLVTDSAARRGMLRAVFWLAPPPYPWSVTPTLRDGFEYLRSEMPRLDVDRVLLEYERLRAHTLGPAGTTRDTDDGVRKAS